MFLLSVKNGASVLNGVDQTVRRNFATVGTHASSIAVTTGAVLTLSSFYSYLYQFNRTISGISIDAGGISVAESLHMTSTSSSVTSSNSDSYAFVGPADGKSINSNSEVTFTHNATAPYSVFLRNEVFGSGSNILEVEFLSASAPGTIVFYKFPNNVRTEISRLDALTINTNSVFKLGLLNGVAYLKLDGTQIFTRNLTVIYTLGSPSLGTLTSTGHISLSATNTLTVGNTAGTYSVTATDLDGNTSSQTIVVSQGANHAPVAGAAITLPAGTVGVPYAVTIPTASFTDSDTTDTQTYSVTGLPAGLTATGLTISGTPTAAFNGTITVTDSDGTASVAVTPTLVIAASVAPTLGTSITLPSATMGLSYNFTIDPSAFVNHNTGNLIYSISGLTNGLTATGLNISGIPTVAGSPIITIRATSGSDYVETTATLPITQDGDTLLKALLLSNNASNIAAATTATVTTTQPATTSKSLLWGKVKIVVIIVVGAALAAGFVVFIASKFSKTERS